MVCGCGKHFETFVSALSLHILLFIPWFLYLKYWKSFSVIEDRWYQTFHNVWIASFSKQKISSLLKEHIFNCFILSKLHSRSIILTLVNICFLISILNFEMRHISWNISHYWCTHVEWYKRACEPPRILPV